MKQFYLLPTATLTANPPNASWHATVAPGNPNVSAVVIDQWLDHASQDAWEALPGIIELHPEMLGLPAPAAVVTAFAQWGVAGGMTLRQAFGAVRRAWPLWRH